MVFLDDIATIPECEPNNPNSTNVKQVISMISRWDDYST